MKEKDRVGLVGKGKAERERERRREREKERKKRSGGRRLREATRTTCAGRLLGVCLYRVLLHLLRTYPSFSRSSTKKVYRITTICSSRGKKKINQFSV